MAQRVKLNLAGLDILRSKLDSVVEIGLMTTAITVRDEAKELAPKDTEQLAESIHIVTSSESDYQEAMGLAREKFETAKSEGKTPKGVTIGPNEQFSGLPEIKPDNPLEVWIVAGMPYAIDNEYGTVRRGPQAFLRPALLNNKKVLTDSIKTAMNDLSVKTKYSEYSKI